MSEQNRESIGNVGYKKPPVEHRFTSTKVFNGIVGLGISDYGKEMDLNKVYDIEGDEYEKNPPSIFIDFNNSKSIDNLIDQLTICKNNLMEYEKTINTKE